MCANILTEVIPSTHKPSNSTSSSIVSQPKTSSKATYSSKPTYMPTHYANSSTPAAPIKTKTTSSYAKYTTSTVSSTYTHTITEHGVVKTVTSVEAAYTTVCPYEGEDDDDEYYSSSSYKKPAPTYTKSAYEKPEVKKPVSYVSSTPVAPIAKTSVYYKPSTTPVAPVLESKAKACYTVTTTVTVY
jgi:hypothetical protein